MRQIAASPYLRLMAALVFLVAIATQWTAFQLSLVADERFGGDADALTRFFGTFNFTLGVGQLSAAAARDGPGAAAVRHCGDRPRAAAVARLRHGVHPARAGVVVGAR